jgi:dimethylaniline monooxygenase (N-oxide forming)
VTISDELPTRVLYGTISIKPNVKEFTQNGVIFDDETKVDNIDIVILATGFKFSFPFLEATKMVLLFHIVSLPCDQMEHLDQ